jgi:hypothetical protein
MICTFNEETKNPASKAYVVWIKATHDGAMQALAKIRVHMGKYHD